MRIISFDCANKSLGVCVAEIPDDMAKIALRHAELTEEMRGLLGNNERADARAWLARVAAVTQELSDIHSAIIKVECLDVFDVIPGKKVAKASAHERAQGIKGVLTYLDQTYPADQVLIEYQMSVNSKSNGVCSSILYHYAKPGAFTSAKKIQYNANDEGPDMRVVSASLKGKICFSEAGRHVNFIKKYASNYAVNKAFSRHNVAMWAAVHDKTLLRGIKKANHDDAGDALLMLVAWVAFGMRCA